MPGWHEKTKELVAEGKLAVAGIVQEQHGDRAALFMQWRRMEWPVMVDSLNLLGVRAVPLTYLIDEHGVIRVVNPKGDGLETFLAADFAAGEVEPPTFEPADEATKLAIAALNVERPDAAALDKAIDARHEGAEAQFRLGVLHRKRYDSPARKRDDFAKAVAAWGAALEASPGQYIWRRRIQQYGPLLDKPYPFYDWVYPARNNLARHGDIYPVFPNIVLSESEVGGSPGARLRQEKVEHPDPENKLPTDTLDLVDIEQTVVPSTDAKKRSYRIHLLLTPNKKKQAKWNNEAGRSSIWLGGVEHQILSNMWIHIPSETEARTVEFEIKDAPKDRLKGSAFYHVCEGEDGVCHYLRHDFEVVFEP